MSISEIQAAIDILHSRNDGPNELFEQFQEDRISESNQKIFDKKEPLVTVCVPTHNRGKLFIQRSLKSLFRQDYTSLEIIIVGD